MLRQCGHIRRHQPRAHLPGILQPDIQPRPDAGTDHQRLRPQQLADGRLHGIEDLGHHRGDDDALNGGYLDAVDLEEGLQIDAVGIGGLHPVGVDAAFKEDLLPLHTAQGDGGVANLNR